jgi:hypothetical protein
MKKASSFLVFLFAALFISLQGFAQTAERLSERVQQHLRFGEKMSLGQLLRLSPQEQRQLEILNLAVSAQSFYGPARIELLQNGRQLHQPLVIRRHLNEVKFTLPAGTRAEGLELSVSEEIFLESVSAEIIRLRHAPQTRPQPYPHRYEARPVPHSILTLQVHQEVRGFADINLVHLVRSQLGLTLEGAEIDHVIVEGTPVMGRFASAASVAVLLNFRQVGGERSLSHAQHRTILPLNTFEEARDLSLRVRGDARIETIIIRVGQVRPNQPRVERISVRREIYANMPLDLGHLMPYESRLVRSVAIETRSSRGHAELMLLSVRGEMLGRVSVSNFPMRPVFQLFRPLSLRELRLETYSAAIIDSVELEFDLYPRY